ncbi:MAG: hypothetical protein QM724_09825 [Flavobacteriales bacterium]
MRTLLLPFLALSLSSLQAQEDDLQALNDHFQGAVVFHIDRQDRLVAELKQNGEIYRRDKAYLDQLDPPRSPTTPKSRW